MTITKANQELEGNESSNAKVVRHRYDFSVRLFVPETLYTRSLGRHWVIFAPDHPGLPMVITDSVYCLLESFRNGRSVAEVLARSDDVPGAMTLIGTLEENGFLRNEAVSLPYHSPSDEQIRPSDFEIWLHITNRCNLGCSYCFVGPKTSSTMDDTVIDTITDSIVKTAVCHEVRQINLKFAGGEPTLVLPRIVKFRSMIEEKLAAESNIPLHVSVLSNGTVVSKELLSFLHRPNTGLGISIDGYGDHHDIYRRFSQSGWGTWKIINRNIGRLVDDGIRPLIMATLSQQSCASLPRLVKWIYESQLRARLSIVRQPNCSWEGGSAARRSEYESHCSSLKQAFEDAFAILEDPAVFMDLRQGFDLCELYFDKPTRGAPCGIGLNHLVIKPDGRMVACPMTVQEDGRIPGDDLFDTCRQCFPYSPSGRAAQATSDECLSCRWFPVCSGGCPITNFRINGHPFSRSPLCDFYKYVIPRYIDFFGRKVLQAAEILAVREESQSVPETTLLPDAISDVPGVARATTPVKQVRLSHPSGTENRITPLKQSQRTNATTPAG